MGGRPSAHTAFSCPVLLPTDAALKGSTTDNFVFVYEIKHVPESDL